MNIKSNILKLRVIAFFLFFTPALALIASLVAHNTLILFPFSHDEIYKFEKNIPGTTDTEIECNEQNDYCSNIVFEKYDKLNQCNKYVVDYFAVSEEGKKLDDPDQNIQKLIKETNQKIFF